MTTGTRTTETKDARGRTVSAEEAGTFNDHWPGAWVRFEAQTARLLRKNRKKMSMTDAAVFFMMVENVQERNLVPLSQQALAIACDTTVQVISRSMKKLIEWKWIERLGPSLYRIDFDLCWRGTLDKRKEQAQERGRNPGELFKECEEEEK